MARIEQRGIVLELRQAIEPWHVLGEEPGDRSTVRYVDSSVERLQVLVTGMVDSRHRVVCNGVALPLHPTGTQRAICGGRALPCLAARRPVCTRRSASMRR